MGSNGNKLEKLESASIEELLSYFGGPKATRESKRALTGAKLALGTLATISRLRATARVKDATQLAVINNIAKNKDEFKKFAQASLPHLVPKKLITSINTETEAVR